MGEFISANRGLGYLVTSAASQFNTTGTMAAILALLLIVAVMDLALTLAERGSSAGARARQRRS